MSVVHSIISQPAKCLDRARFQFGGPFLKPIIKSLIPAFLDKHLLYKFGKTWVSLLPSPYPTLVRRTPWPLKVRCGVRLLFYVTFNLSKFSVKYIYKVFSKIAIKSDSLKLQSKFLMTRYRPFPNVFVIDINRLVSSLCIKPFHKNTFLGLLPRKKTQETNQKL